MSQTMANGGTKARHSPQTRTERSSTVDRPSSKYVWEDVLRRRSKRTCGSEEKTVTMLARLYTSVTRARGSLGDRDLQTSVVVERHHQLAHSVHTTRSFPSASSFHVRVSLNEMTVTLRTSEFRQMVKERAGHAPDAKRRKLSIPPKRSSPESEKQELLNKEYVKEAYNVVSSPSCSDGMLKYTSSSPFGS